MVHLVGNSTKTNAYPHLFEGQLLAVLSERLQYSSGTKDSRDYAQPPEPEASDGRASTLLHHPYTCTRQVCRCLTKKKQALLVQLWYSKAAKLHICNAVSINITCHCL